jgi:hypothetical protein
MRRDQHPAIGPQLRHRQVFKFAEKGVLVDDLASGDVDKGRFLPGAQRRWSSAPATTPVQD